MHIEAVAVAAVVAGHIAADVVDNVIEVVGVVGNVAVADCVVVAATVVVVADDENFELDTDHVVVLAAAARVDIVDWQLAFGITLAVASNFEFVEWCRTLLVAVAASLVDGRVVAAAAPAEEGKHQATWEELVGY